MLSIRDREAAAQSALRWPKHKANLFMRTITHGGKAIATEWHAIRAIHARQENKQFGAPEVAVAYIRQQLTLEGVEKALSDLMRYCAQEGQNYLNMLDDEPHKLADLLMREAKQRELF